MYDDTHGKMEVRSNILVQKLSACTCTVLYGKRSCSVSLLSSHILTVEKLSDLAIGSDRWNIS